MPKRRFPHVRHAPPRWSEFEAHYKPASVRRVLGATNLYPLETIQHWRLQAGHWKRQPKGTLRWPSVNGPNDPLSIMLVLDCIMRLETDAYIQAGGLTALLGREYQQVIWDPVNVGKILAGLHDLGMDAAPRGNGPLGRQSYGGAVMYAMSEDPEAWKYLGAVRQRIGTITEGLIRAAHEDQVLPTRDSSVWDEIGQVAWTERVT